MLVDNSNLMNKIAKKEMKMKVKVSKMITFKINLIENVV